MNEELKEYILKARDSAEDATKDRRTKWKELWKLYQNLPKTSKKKDWQSKCFVPKLFMTIEQATAMVKRAVISTQKLFKMELKPEYKSLDDHSREHERILKSSMEGSNFAAVFSEAMKESFLLGLGVPKVIWDRGLRYYNVDVHNLYIDPKYEPSSLKPPAYVIESVSMDLARFKELAKEANKTSKIWDISKIDEIENDVTKEEKEQERRQRLGYKEHKQINDQVNLLYYWGDVISEDNKKIEDNQLIVVANEKYVVRKQDNPFNHGLPPYTPTVPLSYPHRGAAGVSLVEPIISMQYTYNNTINLLVDNLNWSVNKMFEYQPSNLLNAKALTNVYPGKMVAKHTPNAALEEIRTSNVGNDVYNTLELLNKEIQKGTAVTEYILGSSGKRQTAKEVELKTAQAQGLFDVIARDIEANSLAPLVKMSWKLIVQFSEIPDEYADAYEFKVGGLSLLLMQRNQVDRLIAVIEMANSYPDLKKSTHMDLLWKKYLDVLNLEEAFSEQPEQPTLKQKENIQSRAAEDAKALVEQAQTPEELEQIRMQMSQGR